MSTTSYKDLLAQRAELEAKIEEARKQEISAAVTNIRQLVADFNLTVNDVFPAGRVTRSQKSGNTVAPKYRDPATGQTWTGRGKPPRWIADKDRSQFQI